MIRVRIVVCALLFGSVIALFALGGMAQMVLTSYGTADASVDIRRLPVLDVAMVPGTQP